MGKKGYSEIIEILKKKGYNRKNRMKDREQIIKILEKHGFEKCYSFAEVAAYYKPGFMVYVYGTGTTHSSKIMKGLVRGGKNSE